MTFILITILLILSPLLITNTQDDEDAKENAQDSLNRESDNYHNANNKKKNNNRDNHSNKLIITTPGPAPPSRQPMEKKEQPRINATVISQTYNKAILTYDKKFRSYFNGKAVKIGLDFHVLSFDNPDEGKMEFGVDFYFAQIWFDPRFKDLLDKPHPRAVINLVGGEVDDLWLPDTVFVNSKNSKFHTVTVNNRFLSVNLTDGRIIYHSRITTTASCRLNLRDYPFDEQTCYLAIESYGHDTTDLTFYWFDMMTGHECDHEECTHIKVYDREMSNFDLIRTRKSSNKTAYHAPTFSSATTSFTFRRRSNYFVFQVYIPSALIVMVAWTSFWMTPTAVPARSAICVTTVLTLITMLGIVNANMPRVSYIKALDLYLLVSFLFVFSALFEFILVLNVTNDNIISYFKRLFRCKKKAPIKSSGSYKEVQNGEEKPSGGCEGTLHKKTSSNNSDMSNRNKPLYHATKSCYGDCCPKGGVPTRRKGISETPVIISIPDSDVKVAKGPVGPSTSVIDISARVIFPILYAAFNMAYWAKYVGGRLKPHAH